MTCTACGTGEVLTGWTLCSGCAMQLRNRLAERAVTLRAELKDVETQELALSRALYESQVGVYHAPEHCSVADMNEINRLRRQIAKLKAAEEADASRGA